jgi:hypothetical protein
MEEEEMNAGDDRAHEVEQIRRVIAEIQARGRRSLEVKRKKAQQQEEENEKNATSATKR